MFKTIMISFLVLISITSVVGAQEPESELTVLASDLLYPRGIVYDALGNLYIAEAGVGGDRDVEIFLAGQLRDAKQGATSQVSVLSAEGELSVLVPYIVSIEIHRDGLIEALGAQSVAVHEGSLYVVISENTDDTPGAWAVMEVDLETLQIVNIIDLLGYELAYNPDGRDEIYSNPNDVGVSPDGTLYIVDTGANTLYTWTVADGLEVVQSWDNLVPTGIAFGDDGSYYVSFLGTGIAPGAGHVDHFDADNDLIRRWEGMTAVTDVQVDAAGNVYAVELFIFGEQGPGPGQVSLLTDEGQVVISPPLPLPYGLAIGPNGEMAVSIGAITAGPPMPGQVILLPNMD